MCWGLQMLMQVLSNKCCPPSGSDEQPLQTSGAAKEVTDLLDEAGLQHVQDSQQLNGR